MEYCTKEKTRIRGPWRFGQVNPECSDTGRRQGSRTDIALLKESVQSGKPLLDIWDRHFDTMLRYDRAIGRYRHLLIQSKPRFVNNFEIEIYCGASGKGKTHTAFMTYPDAFWKRQDTWWDSYDGQKVIVWDEFRGNYPFHELLRVLDKYPISTNSKGGAYYLQHEKIVFTTNFEPKDWYKPEVCGPWDDSNPLKRRIDEFCKQGIRYFGQPLRRDWTATTPDGVTHASTIQIDRDLFLREYRPEAPSEPILRRARTATTEEEPPTQRRRVIDLTLEDVDVSYSE